MDTMNRSRVDRMLRNLTALQSGRSKRIDNLAEMGMLRMIQTFGIYRIKKLSRLDTGSVKHEDTEINEYLGKVWSLIPESRLYHVKLKFSPEVAHNVAEVNWHRTQSVTFEKDGSAIVQFRIDSLEEITWWIIGYGDKVQVLAPLTLQQRIVQITQKMIQTNQQELPMRNANPLEA